MISMSIVVGAFLALMSLALGPLALSLVVIIIALPWVVHEPFALYLCLIMTWPVLALYIRYEWPAGMPDISYERVLVPLTMILVLLPALILGGRLPRPGIWVSLYVAAQIISYGLAWSGRGIVEPDLVILLNSLLLPIGMYWLTRVFITSQWHLKWLLYALIIGSLVICITGLFERALDFRESPFPVTTGTASGERYLGVPGGRAAGVMGNPAIYGAALGAGVLASMCCFAHARRKGGKIVLGTIAIVLAYGVGVSFTRSAWIAFIVAVLIAQFLIRGLWRWTILLLMVGLLVMAIIVFGGYDQILENQIVQDRILEKSNVIGRADRMIFAWEIFLEEPLYGRGPDALDYVTGLTFKAGGFDSSHNTYLTMLVDGGVLTFVSFLALIAYWLSYTASGVADVPRESFERSVIGVMVGSIAIYLLSGMALELKYFGYFNALLWIAGASIEQVRAMLQDSVNGAQVMVEAPWPAR